MSEHLDRLDINVSTLNMIECLDRLDMVECLDRLNMIECLDRLDMFGGLK